MLATAMMLDYLNFNDAAKAIRTALIEAFKQGNILTQDLGGNATTIAFRDAVQNHLA